MSDQTNHTDRILSIRGSVIDAQFSERLPRVHHQFVTGTDEDIVAEMPTHLDDETVRRIGSPTQGLARGDRIRDQRGWVDSQFSWRLMLLVLGIGLGCPNACG